MSITRIILESEGKHWTAELQAQDGTEKGRERHSTPQSALAEALAIQGQRYWKRQRDKRRTAHSQLAIAAGSID